MHPHEPPAVARRIPGQVVDAGEAGAGATGPHRLDPPHLLGRHQLVGGSTGNGGAPAIVLVTTTYLSFHWITDGLAAILLGLLLDRILRRVPWDAIPLGRLERRPAGSHVQAAA